MTIKDKLNKLFVLQSEIKDLNDLKKDKKLELNDLMEEIKEYMDTEGETELKSDMGSVIITEQKKSTKFEHDNIKNVINKKVKNDKTSEDIATEILENKQYEYSEKLKIKLKKQK